MSEKTDAPICFRMTRRERAMMLELAKDSGSKSMSHFIRKLLREAYADSLRKKKLYADALKGMDAIVIVPAPGDACGNTKKLPNGSRCPGCRACS